MPTTDQTIEYGVNMLDLTQEEKRTSELVNSVTAHGISTVKKGWWIFSRTSYETITATAQNTLSIAAYGLCSRHIYVDGKKSTAEGTRVRTWASWAFCCGRTSSHSPTRWTAG